MEVSILLMQQIAQLFIVLLMGYVVVKAGILKASDSRQHYTFVCTGIEKAGKEEAILFIGSEYEPISRKDLLRIHERFAADPIGYLKETSPGMQIIVKGEDGQPMHPKNTPYNPIEKE